VGRDETHAIYVEAARNFPQRHRDSYLLIPRQKQAINIVFVGKIYTLLNGMNLRKTKHMTQYLPEILSFLGGLLGGWTLKVIVDKSKNTTVISGNKAGGDIAGRDLNKR
jgi:hypothetical protein